MHIDLFDTEAFERACARVIGVDRPRAGIGTLGEKTLHAILKHFLEPDESRHEIRIGGYYADICGPYGIVEIQTAGFSRLRPKLKAFLPEYPVTVVYPVPCVKWLQWVDEETGEITKKRKSPKVGRPSEVFRELVYMKPCLGEERLTLLILLIDMEEYRLLNGWSTDKKRGSSRFDRIPTRIADAIRVTLPGGLDQLMPADLPAPFTSRQYADASGMRLSDAQRAINVLLAAGRICVVGKVGRLRLYETAVQEPESTVL